MEPLTAKGVFGEIQDTTDRMARQHISLRHVGDRLIGLAGLRVLNQFSRFCLCPNYRLRNL